MPEEISEAMMKKMRTSRKMPMRRWQVLTLRLMWNLKPTLKEK